MKTCYSQTMTARELADLIGLPRSRVYADLGISLPFQYCPMVRETVQLFASRYGLFASWLVNRRFLSESSDSKHSYKTRGKAKN